MTPACANARCQYHSVMVHPADIDYFTVVDPESYTAWAPGRMSFKRVTIRRQLWIDSWHQYYLCNQCSINQEAAKNEPPR